jgi:GntR family transcriptional regulator / MocR family aminotransferase
MPPTRALARYLGVSRNTVVAAYDRLLSEGFLITRTGDGTFVAGVLPKRSRTGGPAETSFADHRLAEFWRHIADRGETPTPAQCRYDFRPGYPDVGRFPFDIWTRLSKRVTRGIRQGQTFDNQPQGLASLRDAIANHVSLTRAIACTSDDIVVTNGVMHSISLLARILVTPGQTEVAIEEPGYPPIFTAFAAVGARVHSVPVDEQGLVVDQLPASARVVVVNPSHHVPLGVTMSRDRRRALLEFALAYDAVVIESDCSGDLRIDGFPLDALQSIDGAGSVFYVGTFARSTFPWVCIGFVVAPPWALTALIAAKRYGETHSESLSQAVLAAFISEGHLARHLRKMRQVYRERYDVLRGELLRHCGDYLTPAHVRFDLHDPRV